MNKITTFFTVVFFTVCANGIAQDNSAAKKNPNAENIYSGIKPPDASPAVFNSQEELDAKIQGKKDNIVLMIQQNKADTAKVRYLRMELWRFENAIVKKPVNSATTK